MLSGIRSALILTAKLALIGVCFWYISETASWNAFAEAAKTVRIPWAAFALVLLAVQIPLMGLRWAEIVGVLAPAVAAKHAARLRMLAITSAGTFFGQIAPNMFGETIRVWMLTGLGVDWRTGLASILIDRVVGIFTLVALAFAAFLVPSPLSHLGGHRGDLLLTLGALLLAGVAAIMLARPIGMILVRHPLTSWLGRYAFATQDVLVRPQARTAVLFLAFLVHALVIAAIWALARAEGLALPAEDAAALFAVIGGAAAIPVSIGGWGLRELGVTALLQSRGIPVEQGLLLSVSFGALMLLASAPGAIAWVLYSPITDLPGLPETGGLKKNVATPSARSQ
jgi:uncharacterized membrane protein YbhN (UPF0104 family)